MFSNRFNTKNDPLVEAVQNAMQDGAIRRQAEALVNEEFGVFNRRAVVREQLAAYDARLEEAYKCIKEGTPENIMNPNSDWAKKQAADKSNPFNQPTPNPTEVAPNIMMRGNTQGGSSSMVDKVKTLFKEGNPNDGNLANNYPPYGKDQMGGKKKKMEEEQIDELTKPTAKTAHKVLNRSEDDFDKSAKAANRLYSWKMKRYPGKTKKYSGTAELPGAGNVEMHQDKYPGYVTKAGKLTKSATKDTKREIKDRLGKHAKPNLPEETDYSAPDRAAVTRDNKPSTPAQTNAATSGPSAADKAALTSKIKMMKEALKGNQHRIDANKNNKIDSQDFKLLRAKRGMKEEQISEIVVQKSQMRPGETLGQAMNRLTGKTAIRGGANDPSSAKFKGPASSSAAGQLAKSGIANMSTGGGAMRTLPSNLDSFQKGISQEKDKTAADSAVRGIRNRNPETKEIDPTKFLYPGAASAAGRATSVSFEPATSSASSMPAAPKPAATSAAAPSMSMSDPKAQKLKESVHVGANKYRIV